jgi:hypothetical protein
MAATTINIGANPEVRGSLKFEGANSIGPQITMTLTLVQLAPSAALNMIGDEYGLIEIQGEVLLVDGSFGTVEHPDDALASPVVDAYYVGTGRCHGSRKAARLTRRSATATALNSSSRSSVSITGSI